MWWRLICCFGLCSGGTAPFHSFDAGDRGIFAGRGRGSGSGSGGGGGGGTADRGSGGGASFQPVISNSADRFSDDNTGGDTYDDTDSQPREEHPSSTQPSVELNTRDK